MLSLDIIIPTYNRSSSLKKNITLLEAQHKLLADPGSVHIIISDNASTDDTVEMLDDFIARTSLSIHLLKNEMNIGAENNVVELLKFSRAPYVMFLGDDDYLPSGYIEFVLEAIKRGDLGCVIPGMASLYEDGSTKSVRTGKDLRIEPGFWAVAKLSGYGHQLSGLTVRRAGALEAYLLRPKLRNCYMFIFFLGHSLQQGKGFYLPSYQTLVTQNNVKYWHYGNSNLLPDLLANYEALFFDRPIKKIICSAAIIWQQRIRLEIQPIPRRSIRILACLLQSSSISPEIKVTVAMIFPFLYARQMISVFRRIAR